MSKKNLLVILGLVLMLGLGFSLAVDAEVSKPASAPNKQLCALKIDLGAEAFKAGRFSEAKKHFRQAVQADPGSTKAWSFYDLSMMYDVAEQFKRKGTIVASSAPTPASLEKAAGKSEPAQPAEAKPVEAKPAEAKPAPPTQPGAPSGAPPGIPKIAVDEGC